MFSIRLICCAVMVAFSTSVMPATKPAPKAASTAPKRLTGKTETLACRLGTEDRHARIAVVLIGGKTDSFAYYSKWKPRTCSIYLQRSRDMYSKWADNGALTTVSLERGAFLIEHKKGEYHFIFREIDRERYCGMDGVINGSLTIRKGSDQCLLDGEIMVEGTPLGQAFVNREEDKPPPGLMPDSVPSAAAQPETGSSEQTATPVEKPAASTPQTSAPAPAKTAAEAAPKTKTAAPASKAAVVAPASDAAPKAAVVAPATETAPKAAVVAPATEAAPKAAVVAPATETTPNAAAAAPGSDPAAKASAAAAPAAAQPQASQEKPADSASTGGVRSFFRSFSQSRTPTAPAASE